MFICISSLCAAAGHSHMFTDHAKAREEQMVQKTSTEPGMNDYEMGFGSLTGELWYGLRALHCLTSSGNWELRIDLTFNNGTKSVQM